MKNVITSVMPDSIAEEVGIEENDILLSVNGEKIVDIIDYRFLTNDEEIVLEIQKPNGEIWDYEIEKDYGEELGLEFGGGIMDKAKRCSNKCMFCFIDQNPKGMRETLYFKDDDSRLSFLQGNFVTLTNMKDEDIDRIIRFKSAVKNRSFLSEIFPNINIYLEFFIAFALFLLIPIMLTLLIDNEGQRMAYGYAYIIWAIPALLTYLEIADPSIQFRHSFFESVMRVWLVLFALLGVKIIVS